MKTSLGIFAAAALLMMAGASFAQRGQRGGAQPAASAQPAEPAPRWPDGRVNLGATPDHKGYWEVRPGLGGAPRAADVPFQPWAKALYQYRAGRTDVYPPLVNCKPGARPSFFTALAFEIVDVTDLQTIFILSSSSPHS